MATSNFSGSPLQNEHILAVYTILEMLGGGGVPQCRGGGGIPRCRARGIPNALRPIILVPKISFCTQFTLQSVRHSVSRLFRNSNNAPTVTFECTLLQRFVRLQRFLRKNDPA